MTLYANVNSASISVTDSSKPAISTSILATFSLGLISTTCGSNYQHPRSKDLPADPHVIKPSLELTLADMQARLPQVASPPPEFAVSADQYIGDMFHLFDNNVVLGLFHFPISDQTRELRGMAQCAKEGSDIHVLALPHDSSSEHRVRIWSANDRSHLFQLRSDANISSSAYFLQESLRDKIIFCDLLQVQQNGREAIISSSKLIFE